MSDVKMTKDCLFPWRSIEFDATGNISPCCGTIQGYFGTVNAEFFNDPTKFNTNDYVRLRKSLLSGELQDSCRECRAIHSDDITTDVLRTKVIQYLQSRGIECAGEDDLTQLFAFDECGGNITNRCNFSCRYCCHSGPKGHSGHLAKVMPQELFLSLIDLLTQHGITIFNFCGLGELTVYPGWQNLIRTIHNRYPKLRIRLISNFGKFLSESDFDVLSLLEIVHVSCDTLDEELFGWLRSEGKLPILLDNINRFIDYLGKHHQTKVVFNVTVSAQNVGHLESLFRFAARRGIFIHLSALFEMEGAEMIKTGSVKKILESGSHSIARIREEFLDLPRRYKAENPYLSIWEYRYLFQSIMTRADRESLHQFVPSKDQLFYHLCVQQISTPNCYLKRFWKSFDDAVEGLYFTGPHPTTIELPWEKAVVSARVYGIRYHLDMNCSLYPQSLVTGVTGRKFVIEPLNKFYDATLVEILSCKDYREVENGIHLTSFAPLNINENSAPILIWEAVITAGLRYLVKHFVSTGEELIIWCAGLRTLEVLSETSLTKANIKAIVDKNSAQQGKEIYGIKVVPPDQIQGYNGKILVLHASSPEQVAASIRKLGFTNEILTP